MRNKLNILLMIVAMLTALGIACSSSDGGGSDGEEGGAAAAASSGEEGAAVDGLDEYKLTQEVDFAAIEVTSDRITRVRRIGLAYSCASERSPTGFEFGQNLSRRWCGPASPPKRRASCSS